MPPYRLEHIFARQKVHVARSTMCVWLAAGAKLLEPLLELLTRRVKKSRVPIQSPGELMPEARL